MAYRSGEALLPLVRRLRAVTELSDSESEALLSLPHNIREAKNGWEIIREGDRPTQSCLVLDGICGRFKIAGHGARQILSYHIRGDIPDLQSLYIETMDHNLAALSSVLVAFIPHHALRELIAAHPSLGPILWRESFIDSSVSREWLCNVGRRNSETRLAHLICELYTRYRAVDGGDGVTFSFPLTQTDLGDAQGLSTVHINRVMQKLKQDGLVSVADRKMTILDWNRLRKTGEFDAGYLHLRQNSSAPSPKERKPDA